MGTGCDTIFGRWLRNVWTVMDNIITQSVTDAISIRYRLYASATTYVTGMAVVKTCEELKKQILHEAVLLDVEESISH